MKDLKNKFIMAPLKLGYAADGFVNEIRHGFYEKEAYTHCKNFK